jgi:dolichol-phosphate mannosyltransferase
LLEVLVVSGQKMTFRYGPGATARMMRISLIIPVSPGRDLDTEQIEAYRDALREHTGPSPVEVVVAGPDGDALEALSGPPIVLAATGTGRVDRLRAGLEAASGEIQVVIDPERPYPPESIAQLVEGLCSAEADLAIGVPGRSPAPSGLQSLRRLTLGLLSRLALGTSDAFSGLVAVRRDDLSDHRGAPSARGSRLVFDLLARPHASQVDVPVATRADDRARVWPLRVDDVRQLKRVLDHRFGTFSRLAQFCLVGASGMLVDLTLYALLQLAWPLARAGALSIFCALLWNFTLNRRLTFNDSRRGSIVRQFLTYVLGNALGIAVSLSLRLYLPDHFGYFERHRLAAAVVGIVVATGISFSMSRWVVFIRHREGVPTPEHAQLTIDSAVP